ncbi:MAG: L,D-transpeptidase, partial [Firmicutes bacterium]|nr:L,D-transpeptidase [Bacillota bacterium]
SWRSNFGGDIYKYSGSHGCVNLPTNKAPELYNLISVGTVVIIHN